MIDLKNLPTKPGSYQFFDEDGKIIYVGKAKNLKKRVSSYFNNTQKNLKTEILVSQIKDIKYIICDTEVEAFLLENNLIKKHKPKYNILLKDDKSYPYIELIKKHPYLQLTRNKFNKDSMYFGPFPDVKSARLTIEVIEKIFPLRRCNPLKKKKCIYYEMGICLGYCEEEIPLKTEEKLVSTVKDILNGDISKVKKIIKERIERYSKNLEFEKAQSEKEKLLAIEKTIFSQEIELSKQENIDLFNIYEEDNFVAINTFIIRGGKLVGSFTKVLEKLLDTKTLVEEYIVEFYDKNKLVVEIVIVPEVVNKNLLSSYLGVNTHTPRRGIKRSLFDKSKKNAESYLKNYLQKQNKKDHKKKLLKREFLNLFQTDISLIEVYDASHLFGTYYVGAKVVYKNFSPSYNDYRKYNIKDKRGDLYAILEMVERNLDSRADLVIIDGGKTQVGIVEDLYRARNIHRKVVGLIKDEKHNTSKVLYQEKIIEVSPEMFLFLKSIQDEVHRFVISFHRLKKLKGDLKSALDEVDGIGEVRKKLLIEKFETVENIKNQPLEKLEEFLPQQVAKNLYQKLH